MNEIADIQTRLTKNRQNVRGEFTEVRSNLDYTEKARRLIGSNPLPWLLGSALLGLLLGGNRRKEKTVNLLGEKVKIIEKRPWIVGSLLLGVRLVLPLLRPVATTWLSTKIAAGPPKNAPISRSPNPDFSSAPTPAPRTYPSESPEMSSPPSGVSKDKKAIFAVLKQTASEWVEDKATMLGASLAYYTVFSLAPLLIIAIAIAGFVLGEEAARGQIYDQLNGLLGDQGGKAMQDIVQNAGSKPTTGLVASIIGIVTLLFGASGVFGQLQTSLNIIWGVEPKPRRGIVGILKDRFLSFGFILVVGFLLLVPSF